ncbi:MAG: hypothetical protein CXT77_03375 [uncultured DHVE6 group euryarchaeote]|jgi:hypothetical protein|nr:MAG: hypothetical protein CXT77_03375 [uncultured DHVE6 group euryarchaeote]
MVFESIANHKAAIIGERKAKCLIRNSPEIVSSIVEDLEKDCRITYDELNQRYGLNLIHPSSAISMMLKFYLGKEKHKELGDSRYKERVKDQFSEEDKLLYRQRAQIANGSYPFDGPLAVCDIQTKLTEGDYLLMLASSEEWKHGFGTYKGKFRITELTDHINEIFGRSRNVTTVGNYLSESLSLKKSGMRIIEPWHNEQTEYLLSLIKNPKFLYASSCNHPGKPNQNKIASELNSQFGTNRTASKVSQKLKSLEKLL